MSTPESNEAPQPTGQHPAGRYVPPYGYPMAQPVRTPTGTLSWALGFLIFLPIPLGTARASSSKSLRVPFAIPYIRA